MADEYDVIIVGSGCRRRHARPPARTVGQARPDPGARRLAASRDRELGRRGGLRRQPLRLAGHLVRRHGKPFQPQVHYFVGGATKFYGAALYRLREQDFGELKHHDGISPAWPIGYDVFEPYYTQAEQLYQVHGARGEDPTEPPASAPYPFPPVSHEPRIQTAVRRHGRGRAAPLPLAVRRHARRGEPGVQRLHPMRDVRRVRRAWSTPSPTPR